MFNNKQLLKQLAQTGLLFPATVFFGLVSGGLILWQAWQLSAIINGVFLEKQTLLEVKGLLILFLGIVLVRVLFTLLNETTASWLAVKIKTRLRQLLIEKIDRLGPSYTRKNQSGELVTTALQGVEALDAYFSQYLPQVVLAISLPLLILSIVFPLDWVSGLVFVLTAPLIPFFMYLVGKAAENETKKQWKALTRLGADFLDTLQGLTTLKIFGQSKNQTKRVQSVSEQYSLTTMKVLRITFLSALVLELLATISTAVVAVEIGLRLLYGHLVFQQAFFVLLLAPEFYQPLRNLGMRYHAGMTGVTAAARIFELLDEPEPTSALYAEAKSLTPNFSDSFELTLKNVSFSYPDNLEESLIDIDFSIKSGMMFALAGVSGAGKSTLLHLLMRFIEPNKGKLLLNGDDAVNYSLESWRSQIGWVSQQPVLFNTTLRENIRLENPTITDTQVWQALEMAQLAEFAKGLPLGLETQLHEWGSRLSGGQGQRVALARAYLKNAPLVLMDEPTAHLDPELEESLTAGMRQLFRNRTVVIIAHRFSTILKADRIIALDKGRLIGEGTHGQLLSECEGYARLFRGWQGEAS